MIFSLQLSPAVEAVAQLCRRQSLASLTTEIEVPISLIDRDLLRGGSNHYNHTNTAKNMPPMRFDSQRFRKRENVDALVKADA